MHNFDLELPADMRKLADPMLALEDPTGTVVLDEIQSRLEVFPVLRVLADRPRRKARFLVLGSASTELLAQGSESISASASSSSSLRRQGKPRWRIRGALRHLRREGSGRP